MLKNYRFSLILGIVICMLNLMHRPAARWFRSAFGSNFPVYIIYAVFLAFFLVILFKVISAKKNQDIAIILLCSALIYFFLLTHPDFLFKLTILELFLLGVLVAWEGKKGKSLLPFLFIAVFAVLVELCSTYGMRGNVNHFYYFDAWRNGILALCGYLSGSLIN